MPTSLQKRSTGPLDTWVTSHVWRSHVTRVKESRRTCLWVMSHVWIRHVPQKIGLNADVSPKWRQRVHSESCHTCESAVLRKWTCNDAPSFKWRFKDLNDVNEPIVSHDTHVNRLFYATWPAMIRHHLSLDLRTWKMAPFFEFWLYVCV